ncbi:DegT/DnrJ/EryC1/StrS family aminotransferase [Novipirellula sp.]|uniref:DegT/DnrJ/EryC1/StrS family aminotransferase n=1 Tax=Novipirellula sp. TaxID=2795430 RepID=UPI00356AC085
MSNSRPRTRPILTADPGRATRARIDELTQAFQSVIQSGWFVLGKQVESFEQAFSQWQQVSHTIGVANGTDAIELCLRACGVGDGDLVIVPTHTAVATATAVCRAGGEPLLLDIELDSFNLDLNQVEDAITQPNLKGKIKAIVPVHLYGNPCDMTRLKSLASAAGIAVIEDCSQAHGAKWEGQKVGCFGDAAAFSCYPTKNLGALGDAGLCVTASEAIADRIRFLRQYGWHERYVSDEVGMNSRLDELHAALLSIQLQHLNEDLETRKRIADRYRRELSGLPIDLPSVAPSSEHAYHQFTILVAEDQRDLLQQHLQQHDIFAAVLYPMPIHLQPAYANPADKFPFGRHRAEQACKRLLCLPMHAFLSDEEVSRVILAIRSFNW